MSVVAGCRQLDLSVQLQKTACQRTQLQLMCYQWLYEDVLMNAGHQPNSGPRATLMTDLKKVMQWWHLRLVVLQLMLIITISSFLCN